MACLLTHFLGASAPTNVTFRFHCPVVVRDILDGETVVAFVDPLWEQSFKTIAVEPNHFVWVHVDDRPTVTLQNLGGESQKVTSG